MAVTVFKPEENNASQAPTLGMGSGTFGVNAQQRKNIAQGGSGRFTNLQQYVQANESNPNAQLLQKEATARQGELGTRQQEFVKQAEPIKTGFETIRSGQQFVQSALDNPTQIAADPTQLQRFAGYRTQGIGDIETPFNQLQTARGTLGTQQQQLASGLETIQRDPNALQNYLQSQRANPSLATRGENVLDRFLTQSTESGQRAIAGLGTTATGIRASQTPEIASQIESLRTQAQGKPLSSADVSSLLTGKITPEEEYIRNINQAEGKNLIARNLGKTTEELDQPLGELNYNINKIRRTIGQREKNLRDAENSTEYRIDVANLENSILADPRSSNNSWTQRTRAEGLKNINEKFKNKTDLGTYAGESYIAELENSPYNKALRDYEKKVNQLSSTNKQQLLQQYDPTRLSRIQALQQLAGTTQFNPLLSGGIQ